MGGEERRGAGGRTRVRNKSPENEGSNRRSTLFSARVSNFPRSTTANTKSSHENPIHDLGRSWSLKKRVAVDNAMLELSHYIPPAYPFIRSIADAFRSIILRPSPLPPSCPLYTVYFSKKFERVESFLSTKSLRLCVRRVGVVVASSSF